jgi:hypothetical protein
MKLTMTCLAALLALANAPAHAVPAKGGSALALATLVADQSSTVGGTERRLLKRLLNGRLGGRYTGKISVEADSVVCRVSNVDITLRSCDLVFGKETVTLSGRRSHELYATLIELGIQPEGAAGSMIAGIKRLKCTIDPQEIREKAGGGADCTYDVGGP